MEYYSLIQQKKEWTADTNNMNEPWKHAKWKITSCMIPLMRNVQNRQIHQFSRSVVSDSLQPHGLQHARLPCPSPTPGAYSNSCPLSRVMPNKSTETENSRFHEMRGEDIGIDCYWAQSFFLEWWKCSKIRQWQGLPWWSSGKDSALPTQRARLIPDQGTRSHMPQIRVQRPHIPQLKTQHSQIHR